MEMTIRAVLAAAGAALSYLYGGWSALLQTLLVFAVLDYVAGVTAAGLQGRLSSAIGARGIARKVGMFVVVAIAHLVDQALGSGPLLRDAAIFWYLANELLSLIENAGLIGIPVPPVLAQTVEVLRKRGSP